MRRRRQVDLDTILDVFGQPPAGNQGNQFGQGGGQPGQNGNQFGGNQFGQGGNQFGQGGNQFGQGGNQGGQGTDPFGNNQFGGATNTNAPVDNNPTTTTQSPRVRQCIANCQTTPQYSPVCGSNGIQYMNMEKLNCARRCGVGKCQYFITKIILQQY